MKKTILSALLLFISLSGVWGFRHKAEPKREFTVEEISSEISYHSEWETPTLTSEGMQEVKQALGQAYRYLGSGGQCVNFVSADDKYVIKFFKQKKFAVPDGVFWFKQKKQKRRDERRDKVFSAFQLCFQLVPEETGLLYLHLNPTDHLKTILTLSDDQGKSYVINLDELQFVLQRKVELASHVLAHRDLPEAKHALDQLLNMYVKFYQKGIRNRDPNFRSNCGFLGTKALLIDVGRVVYSEEIKQPENYKQELLEMTPHFRKYLSHNHPALLEYFDTVIAKIIHSEDHESTR